jgi:hypothetical protein
MIYELKNKVPHNSSFLTSEDVLTSTVFGNLRYFHNQALLIKFLNEAVDLFGNKLDVDTESIFKIHFWKKFYHIQDRSKYNEPDLFLNNKFYRIIIECKYYSILSESKNTDGENVDNYYNQLLKYAKIIERSEKNKIIIYLTNDAVAPSNVLKKTMLKLNKNIRLYWLSWKSLYRILKYGDTDCIYPGENQLRIDLLAFLRKRGMTMFCGFTLKPFVVRWNYRKYFTYGIPCNISLWRYKNEK